MCLAWYALDVFFTSSTIMHLTVISIDRYIALRYPLKFGASRRGWRTACRIACVWILASMLAGPLFVTTWLFNDTDATQEAMAFKGCGPENATFILPAVLISFYLPLVIMTSMYIATITTLHKEAKRQGMLQLKKLTAFKKEDTPASRGSACASSGRSSEQQCAADDEFSAQAARTLQLPLLRKNGSTESQSLTDTAPTNTAGTYSTPAEQKSRNTVTSNGRKTLLHDVSLTQESTLTTDDTISSSDNTMDEESTPPSNSPAEQQPPPGYRLPQHQLSFTQRLRSKLRAKQRHRRQVRMRGVNSQDNNRKAVKVLGVLFIVFVVFYLPFFMTYTIRAVCSERCAHQTLDRLIQVFEILAYGGSVANPIVYHIFSKEFREVFYRIVSCKSCTRR